MPRKGIQIFAMVLAYLYVCGKINCSLSHNFKFIMSFALSRVTYREHFVGILSVCICKCLVCRVVLLFGSYTLVIVTLYYQAIGGYKYVARTL